MTNNGNIYLRGDIIRIINERYKIISILQATANSVVSLCHDQVIGNHKVIKEIKKNKGKDLGEFEVLKNLQHPGLPHVYDVFEDMGSYYIVLELIEGKTIKDLVESSYTFTIEEATELLKKILYILQYLHTLQPNAVIHGDVKPENIIINDQGVYLIDFASVTNQKGTSNFIAPERLLGKKKNIQSDIYSLGLVAYYMLTGKMKKIFEKIQSEQHYHELFSIIEKCSKKNSMERYSSTSQIINDLNKITSKNQENIARHSNKIISIQGNSMLAGELAHVLSKYCKKKTLLIDTNIFSGELDNLINHKKCKLYLQDYLFEYNEQLYKPYPKGNLSILPCRVDIEGYENFNESFLDTLMAKHLSDYEVIIINCTDYIYDSMNIKSMYLADYVIFSVQYGINDIRKNNAIIDFLCRRQQLSRSRFFVVQFNSYHSHIRQSITSKAIEANWLGVIPYSKKRSMLTATANNYATKIEKNIRRKYVKLIKQLAI